MPIWLEGGDSQWLVPGPIASHVARQAVIQTHQADDASPIAFKVGCAPLPAPCAARDAMDVCSTVKRERISVAYSPQAGQAGFVATEPGWFLSELLSRRVADQWPTCVFTLRAGSAEELAGQGTSPATCPAKPQDGFHNRGRIVRPRTEPIDRNTKTEDRTRPHPSTV